MHKCYADLVRYCCVFVCLIVRGPNQCSIKIGNKHRISWLKVGAKNKNGEYSLQEQDITFY